jgi:hypothetical protein
MDDFQASTAALFICIRQAREIPECSRRSPAFQAARAQLEKSENRAIRQHALRLPIAYQDVGDSA